jgi:carbon-monoxide dehydrogenase iron sulfur subunit
MVDSVIAIDYDKCTGCRICELVCSMKNSGEINPVKSRIRIVRIGTDVTTISFPVLCMQCVEAFCMIICPLGAISEDSITGARIINKDKCIACSACVYACRSHARPRYQLYSL